MIKSYFMLKNLYTVNREKKFKILYYPNQYLTYEGKGPERHWYKSALKCIKNQKNYVCI